LHYYILIRFLKARNSKILKDIAKNWEVVSRKGGCRKKYLKLLIFYFHMTSQELSGKKEGILTDICFSSRNK
jgi:hypothetical protein